jgi:tRNA threonylcarbamoyl adenosine modification protein (Sua5/YciO/YrdC/YwlC family)
MIESVHPGNIDDRILSRSAKLLKEGAVLALPTDTSWSLVCSLHSKEGIEKLRRLSGERNPGRFTLLCSNLAQLSEFCALDNSRFRLIRKLTPGPYTIILTTLHGTEKTLGLKRAELGVRIPATDLVASLIENLGSPLYGVTAKKVLEELDEDDEEDYFTEDTLYEAARELEELEGVDLILDTGQELERIYSTILDMTGDDTCLVRQGAGPWPL